VRLIGDALRASERALRALGAAGYGGGIALFVVLAVLSVSVVVIAIFAALALSGPLAWIVHGLLLYSLLALGDLVHHVWGVERALARAGLDAGRAAIGHLVGRDIDRMDAAACRRAAIESLSENLTDGFVSALFWYVLLGLPGLVLFKVVSTMDSMVGYKTPQYLRFGWCGARLDDVMNYLPARLTWVLLALTAAVVPHCSARKAWVFGRRHASLLPSPNSGWSEAAIAGAIQRRLAGPIWKAGQLVTEIWIGDPDDPPAADRNDVSRAIGVAIGAAFLATALAEAVLFLVR
jgi:adenosylcobinamide-phosphate synthase